MVILWNKRFIHALTRAVGSTISPWRGHRLQRRGLPRGVNDKWIIFKLTSRQGESDPSISHVQGGHWSSRFSSHGNLMQTVVMGKWQKQWLVWPNFWLLHQLQLWHPKNGIQSTKAGPLTWNRSGLSQLRTGSEVFVTSSPEPDGFKRKVLLPSPQWGYPPGLNEEPSQFGRGVAQSLSEWSSCFK